MGPSALKLGEPPVNHLGFPEKDLDRKEELRMDLLGHKNDFIKFFSPGGNMRHETSHLGHSDPAQNILPLP